MRASTKKAGHLHRRGHELFVKLKFLRNAFLDYHFFWSRSAICSPPIHNRESIALKQQQQKCFLLPPDAQPSTRNARHLLYRVHYIIVNEVRWQFCEKLYMLSLLESLCHIPPSAIYNIVSTIQQTLCCNSITEYYRESSVLQASYKK